MRLAGHLHDRRRRPHVSSQGELLIITAVPTIWLTSVLL